MLLDDKNAVIYGGGAVARAFAREGARVFLAGRTAAKLEQVAEEIRSAGGAAETAQVDALDEKAVDAHADAVAAEAGGIDISFNLISHGDVQGTPAGRDGARGLHPTGRDCRQDDVPDLAGGRAPDDQAGIGRGPRVRRLGRPAARLLPGRSPGRFEALESMRRQLAAFVASDRARTMTAATTNISCGALVD